MQSVLDNYFDVYTTLSKLKWKSLISALHFSAIYMISLLICLSLPSLKVLPVKTVPLVTIVLSGGPTVVTASLVSVTATQMCVTEKLADVW